LFAGVGYFLGNGSLSPASQELVVNMVLALDWIGSIQTPVESSRSSISPRGPIGDSRLLTSERLYYTDSFLSKFTGAVTDVRELLPDHGESAWRLTLDRTAFYPTSGGQPFDTGVLSSRSNDGGVLELPVEKVEEDEGGAVWHFVRKPLAAGTRVEGHIDWDRRFDHMQQHTGQHLLSAVFLRELRAPTVSFHLGDKTSTIDLAGAPLMHDGLERVERIVNQIIGEDRSITTGFVPRAEAEAMLAAGELRKLPDRQGTIRLIVITDCDRNACGGTHVRSTGQIGGLLVRGVEKVRQGSRVEFVCGLRAVRAARADAAILAETSALLSGGASDLPAAVGRLLTDAKANAKGRQKLHEELAALQAMSLIKDVPIENGLRLVVRAWKDQERDYVKLLASRTAAAAPSTAVIFFATDTDTVRVFVARSPDLDFNCGRILRDTLARMGQRGGGSTDLAQGEIQADQEPALRASITEEIQSAVAESQSRR
jgi:alanyl-tRNA synthetase